MPGPLCRFCADLGSPRVIAIDGAILLDISVTEIAARFDEPRATMFRHKRHVTELRRRQSPYALDVLEWARGVQSLRDKYPDIPIIDLFYHAGVCMADEQQASKGGRQSKRAAKRARD